MSARFEWNKDKAASNLEKHGVSVLGMAADLKLTEGDFCDRPRIRCYQAKAYEGGRRL